MFYYCTRLEQAPEILPATTLKNACYVSMFMGCSSLEKAPILPATTLADACYETMFAGCTRLEIAPDLPARSLLMDSYINMFDNCTRLKYIKCLATELGSPYDDTPTYRWMRGVPPGGHFVKHPDNDWWTTGEGGIPEGWTVSTATE